MGEAAVAEATKHEDKLGEGAKKRKKLRDPQDKVHAVMKEFEQGTLHSSSGEIVTDREQALAIAMSEAGLSKDDGKKSIVIRMADGSFKKAVLVDQSPASGSGDNSYEGRVAAVSDAWYNRHRESRTETPNPMPFPYIESTYASYIVTRKGAMYYRVPYTITDGKVDFGEPEEVKRIYIKKAQGPPVEVWLSLAKAELSTVGRKRIKKKNFALAGRRYPIHDRAHAINALARVEQHGTPEEKKRVRAAVHRKYPDLGGEDDEKKSQQTAGSRLILKAHVKANERHLKTG